jgi:hypothetical protein
LGGRGRVGSLEADPSPINNNAPDQVAKITTGQGPAGSIDMKSHVATTTCSSLRRRPGRVVALVLIALGSHTGCGREFYREWANQDASEAIYEKSRDPRYRLDVFSWEPPALARYADPYDRDRPPAPPDDFASQSLSPVPQWPDHRLIMPVEGTGYLKVLDQGPRYTSPPPRQKPQPAAAPALPKPEIPPPPLDNPPFTPTPSATTPSTSTPANPPGTPGPGASRSNSGTGGSAMSPTSLAGKASPTPAANPAFTSAVTPAARELSQRVGAAGEIQRSSFQDPAAPMPTQIPPLAPDQPQSPPLAPDQPNRRRPTNPTDPLQSPRIPGDPNPSDPDLSKEVDDRLRRPGMDPRQIADADQVASNLARMFVPEDVPMDEAVAAGLPAGSRPYVLTMEKAYQLALFNARVYQSRSSGSRSARSSSPASRPSPGSAGPVPAVVSAAARCRPSSPPTASPTRPEGRAARPPP